jgi:hypothetical protein
VCIIWGSGGHSIDIRADDVLDQDAFVELIREAADLNRA